MNSFLKLTAILSLLILSCDNKKTEKDGVIKIVYKKPIIQEVINGFINATIEDGGKEYITVDLDMENDTTTLALVNTFPDFRHADFRFYDTVNNHKIIFIGKPDEKLYSIVDNFKAPKELLELSEKTYHSNLPPPAINPKQWFFYFKHDSLIGYYPEDDIKIYLQLSK